MLLPGSHAYMGPQCIVGVGVAEPGHLLQEGSNVLSRDGKRGRRRKREIEM